MSAADWSRHEVEAIVADCLSMLASELSGSAYSKTAHGQALRSQLSGRSDQSIEYKHANTSAALLDAGFPYISGYKARFNYQGLLAEVLAERVSINPILRDIAAFDADRPMVTPEVDDILSVLTEVSEKNAHRYQVYRMFSFREAPRLYTLRGSVPHSCQLSAATFLAPPR